MIWKASCSRKFRNGIMINLKKSLGVFCLVSSICRCRALHIFHTIQPRRKINNPFPAGVGARGKRVRRCKCLSLSCRFSPLAEVIGGKVVNLFFPCAVLLRGEDRAGWLFLLSHGLLAACAVLTPRVSLIYIFTVLLASAGVIGVCHAPMACENEM